MGAEDPALNWLTRLPVEEVHVGSLLAVIGVGVVLMVAGYLGYRHRDLHEGA